MATTAATLDRLFDGQAGHRTESKLCINLENERLLQEGGVAVDDYSDHRWTLREI